MNIRRLLRRRTATPAPAVPQQPALPAWEQPGHFQVGDMVQLPPGDDYRAKVVWVEGDRVGILTNPANGAQANAAAEHIRHLDNCEPCLADAVVQAATEEQREAAYWSRWPDDETELYDAVMEDMVPVGERRYRFGDSSPVREWMRTEFDGHLVDDEMPSLTLGRIWDPLDWPRIEREHTGNGLTITNPWNTVPWPVIRDTFEVLQDAGYAPFLDASVEMERLDDGTIGADVIICSLAVEGHLDDATYEKATALLGDATEFPCSHISYPTYPDRPGIDRSQPYQVMHYTSTGWNWSGGAWMSPFNPPAPSEKEETPA
ncbi:hypothetical protein ACFY12_34125 [Streptomyces sp. NPDC001339]|uniref:hypothetical protein n=1 Tax=Streptomyces sp. NPDC001339 TaxID=3364563 RepID=UPI0036B9D987